MESQQSEDHPSDEDWNSDQSDTQSVQVEESEELTAHYEQLLYEGRLSEAVRLVREEGMLKTHACVVVGIDRGTFDTAVKFVDTGHLPPRGRKRAITANGEKVLKTGVINASLHLSAMNEQSYSTFFDGIVASEQNNSHVKRHYCDRTKRNYQYRNDLTKHLAEVKAKKRKEAFTNIRNNISLIATMDHVHDIVCPEQFLSTDDTSVLLYNDRDTVKVITHQTAIEQLKEYNTAISTVQDMPQQRVVTFSFTITAAGALLCSVIKIYDRNFTKQLIEPAIFKMDERLYVCLHHYDMDDTVLNKAIYDGCIVPEAEALRRANIPACEPISIPPVGLTPEQIYAKYKYIALGSDGAFGPINALLHKIHQKHLNREKDIILVKYAAGTSMIQQPNDTGHMHRILKLLFHSKRFKYDRAVDPPGENWKQRKLLLTPKLSTPSFKTLWRCLCNAKGFIDKAFNMMNIKHAFADCGIFPFDPELILSVNPHFRSLNQAKSDVIMNNLDKFKAKIVENGCIAEQDYVDILGDKSEGVDNHEETGGTDVDKMSIIRHRAVLYSHPTYFANQVTKRVREEERLANLTEEALRAQVEQAVQADQDDETLVLQDIAVLREEKKKKRMRCGNARCEGEYDSRKGWKKCTKECPITFCLLAGCAEERLQHIMVCKAVELTE
eukprot:gene32334-39921_t